MFTAPYFFGFFGKKVRNVKHVFYTKKTKSIRKKKSQHTLKSTKNRHHSLHLALHKFYLFLIIVPPITRGIYTCYYKMDGFNHSLPSLHIHTMPGWTVWLVVTISELVFFIYGIKHGAIDNTPKTPTALFQHLKKLTASISPTKLYKEIRHNHRIDDRKKALARLIILINLFSYVWISGDAAYSKFYQVFHYQFQSVAVWIGVFCAIGALMSTMTFSLTVVVKTLPHIFKIKTIYATLTQKVFGFFKLF